MIFEFIGVFVWFCINSAAKKRYFTTHGDLCNVKFWTMDDKFVGESFNIVMFALSTESMWSILKFFLLIFTSSFWTTKIIVCCINGSNTEKLNTQAQTHTDTYVNARTRTHANKNEYKFDQKIRLSKGILKMYFPFSLTYPTFLSSQQFSVSF